MRLPWQKRPDADLQREILSDLELETTEQQEQGVSTEEARYAARRSFGNSTLILEQMRDTWRWTFFDRLWQDVRFSTRTLRKSPSFTMTALLSLALGIGANTGIFSLLYTVLLKPLAVSDPQSLVVLAMRDPRNPNDLKTRFSYPDLQALKQGGQPFDGPFTYVFGPLKLDSSGPPEPVKSELVSGNYFTALQVSAQLGRTFDESDDRKGNAHAIAVISHRLWQQRFGGNPAVTGKVIRLNGYPVTIAGVMPADFFGTQVGIAPDIWLPIQLMDRLSLPGMMLENRDATWMPAMARLKPGFSREQAEAAANVFIDRTMTKLYGPHRPDQAPHLVLLRGSRGLSKFQQQFSRPLVALMVLVALVLLIACANVANLALSRAVSREKEIVLRTAIGASRGRLIQQFLTEGTLLALASGLLGLLFACLSTRALIQVLPAARSLSPQLDWRVLAFCLATSIVTGLFFGLAPVTNLTESQITPGRSRAGHSARSWWWLSARRGLLLGQITVAVVLLATANLFIQTIRNLYAADRGFQSSGVLQASVSPRQMGASPAQIKVFYDQLLTRVQALPGMRKASIVDAGLMSGQNQSEDLYQPGYQPRANEDVFSEFRVVSPGFFQTLGIKQLRGRTFEPRDTATSSPVAIVNDAYARYFFAGRDPLGKHIGIGGKPEMEIVGVVASTTIQTMRDRSVRVVYFPLMQSGSGDATLYVQSSVGPANLVSSIRKTVASLDRNAAIYDIKTLAEQIDESVAQERLIAWLSGFFGLFALALAAAGLYALISYEVSRRTQEIGIRMALGAQKQQIVRPMLRETALLTAAGILLGLIAALAVTRFIAALLYGLTPADPASMATSALSMLTIALLAVLLPAARITRVNPMVALRYE